VVESGRLAAYVELVKVRLSALAVFAVLAGLFLGAEGVPSWWLVLPTLVGTIAVAAGGNALNMYIERDSDPKMERTEGRPLPTGRLSPVEVRRFGLICAGGGLGLLWAMTNVLATGLCLLVFTTYVVVYTPMKRLSTFNTLVGAVPGALPPVVGYAAASGRVDFWAVVLFLIVFFWQIPHFLAIAWRYRDQYRRAGLKMLPVVDTKGHMTAVQMVVYCVCLLAVSVLPSTGFMRMTGELYMYVAILLGAIFLLSTVFAAVVRTPFAMYQCFSVSIIYLPLLFSAMVLDKYLTAVN
jgi:protoheme IX farnesyltransferase